MDKEELYGEDRLAAETRIRNLLWTVSGDYDLSCELDIDSFQKAKEISLYDAIKQGAFARFFDTEAFGLYLVKKIYLGAEEGQLMGIAPSFVWMRLLFQKWQRNGPECPIFGKEPLRRSWNGILED